MIKVLFIPSKVRNHQKLKKQNSYKVVRDAFESKSKEETIKIIGKLCVKYFYLKNCK